MTEFIPVHRLSLENNKYYKVKVLIIIMGFVKNVIVSLILAVGIGVAFYLITGDTELTGLLTITGVTFVIFLIIGFIFFREKKKTPESVEEVRSRVWRERQAKQAWDAGLLNKKQFTMVRGKKR